MSQQADLPSLVNVISPQGQESNAQRLDRIRGLVSIGAGLDPLDGEWLLKIFLEQSNAINWGTNCLSCATTLDHSVNEYQRREQVEVELVVVGQANLRLQTALLEAEGRLTSVSGELDEARTPKHWYETDMNVRRAGNRLVAYTTDADDVPDMGQVVIVGTAVDAGIAVLARVHNVRKLPRRVLDPTDLWAIEVDWLPEHWA